MRESPIGSFLLRRAAAPTLGVLAAYLIFTVVALGWHRWDPLWFAWIGERYSDLEPGGDTGYDGQFVYYIARYGLDSLSHLDNPAYRLQRIGYPLAVWALSAGQPALMPWVMIAINLAAIVVTTRLLSVWLSSQGLSAWYSLLYAGYVGTFMAFSRDLTEPLAFALVAAGILAWLRRRVGWAVVWLACAALTKEITLLVVFGIVAVEILERHFRTAVVVSLAVVPLALWELALYALTGVVAFRSGPTLEWIPLAGIIPILTPDPGRWMVLAFVSLPALAALVRSGVGVLHERPHGFVWWTVLFNALFAVLMPSIVCDHLMHAGRNTCGLALALVFALPRLGQRWRWLALVIAIVPSVAWLGPILRWNP
ncbi:MAG: hypothetical protein JNL73_06045 [Anaerolineales bacterium]|nr:hypothetical protein [Anaerolineales bacterium]